MSFFLFPFSFYTLQLDLPALNLSILDTGILIMVQQVKIDDVIIEHHVRPLTVHLKFLVDK